MVAWTICGFLFNLTKLQLFRHYKLVFTGYLNSYSTYIDTFKDVFLNLVISTCN